MNYQLGFVFLWCAMWVAGSASAQGFYKSSEPPGHAPSESAVNSPDNAPRSLITAPPPIVDIAVAAPPAPCAEYIGKGGPIAGVVVSPFLLGGGAGLISDGIDRKEFDRRTSEGKAEIGVGVVMIVAGVATLIASSRALRSRNKKRRFQRLAGCPSYR